MESFLAITKALSDESRVRALMALTEGELCVCQIIEVLGLSPATVSKHMSILQQAGFVTRRKDGRWHYYRLAGRDANPVIKQAIKWVFKSLEDEKVIQGDAKSLCCIRDKDRQASSACCYNKN
ncbi:MAG TPA: ArsR family transcriptional regulator [Phycisphaerales bacterium]|nr:ArsR family transcriptional regulator [Phycisphaerales bacterium]HCD34053.1 ArsR family transcriptional regulator [Phycisphaerales bacterium]|tara:strand:- start:759 stop:1127 length:369 start_codon:yes stop_codon:yes gene_type:complete